MSVWPLVNKLRILQGSVYNLFDFTELDCAPSFLLVFFLLLLLGFFLLLLKDCCCSAEGCDCAYKGLAREGICHAIPRGYELLQHQAGGVVL